jgi:hypothetical protein
MGHSHAGLLGSTPDDPRVHAMHAPAHTMPQGAVSRTAENAGPCPARWAASSPVTRSSVSESVEPLSYQERAIAIDALLRASPRADAQDPRPPRPPGPLRHALLQRFIL